MPTRLDSGIGCELALSWPRPTIRPIFDMSRIGRAKRSCGRARSDVTSHGKDSCGRERVAAGKSAVGHRQVPGRDP
jgi:hypothetical protein